MKNLHRFALSALIMIPACCGADEIATRCPHDEVDAHVRAQYLLYGPQSRQYEYFGYVYRYQGVIGSAVMRSHKCRDAKNCGLHTAAAAKLIPAGARVLGEWHTHPHQGSGVLSREDARGAYDNRHIACYRAYYSTPGGEILAWDPQQVAVREAMASAEHVGTYRPQVLAGTKETEPDNGA
jgi:hypothetical protein